MLAHWRKLAGASHFGISCHVDPVPAKLFSPLVQTASPELAYSFYLGAMQSYIITSS